MAKPGGQKDTEYLLDTILKYQISVIHFVPSMLRLFLTADSLDRTKSLRLVVCSGEALSVDLEQQFFRKIDAALYNLYGPTEAAVDVSWWQCRKDSMLATVPIGMPIANIQLYILNDQQQPVEIGEKGELYIGGVGLARGYLNRPDLTEKTFVHLSTGDDSEIRLYKTGDICRYLEDGAIEYIGRADFQVKIRGFRVELGEIENAIRQAAPVNDCVVVAREDIPGDKRLVAYVIAKSDIFSQNDLLAELHKKLPEYMIPSAVVQMDSFPLLSNGKLDRGALPKPGRKRPEQKQNYVGAGNSLEKQFENAWCSVLGYDTVGIDDNFFDLGGNSFLAIQVLQFLKEVHGIVLPVIKMFELPTIRTLAQYYGEKDKVESHSMETVAVKNNYDDAGEFEDDALQNAVAVIGMSGRFPGASDLDTFWKNLCDGVESVKHFSREELLEAGVPQELLDNPHYIKSAPLIDDVECFDAAFFGYNPDDASSMDPQHRLFLEACWSALEDAGCNPEEYGGKIGVFAGCSMNCYFLKNVLPVKGLDQPLESFMAMIGNEKDYLATKVAYCLNLTGPAINVQTGCSTALVGAHLACQSLLNYECDMALAGGATVRTPQKEGYLYTEGMIASKDGHCRTFDEHASGTVFGEGVGVVLLKRYYDAVKDRDPIDAVILGTAVNNDGSLKVGYTAPSVNGQRDVIESAQAMANVTPQDISFIEAHGTGTLLGDPIEVKALAEVFRQGTEKHCALGSLKPNIGHLDAAAGIAGLIKTILVLKHRKVPPVINMTSVNPKLELEKTPFFINTECTDLQPSPLSTDKTRLLAGVSSFGVGGTNVHAVLQAENGIVSPVTAAGMHILPCSARTPGSLQGNLEKLGRYLTNNSVSVRDIACTLRNGRKQFPYREVVVADSAKSAGEQFEKISRQHNTRKALSQPSVTFMFTGQGSQYVNMGKKLYDNESLFRKHVDECARLIDRVTGTDILAQMFIDGDPSVAMSEHLKRTEVTQPALFAIEYSLAQVLIAWGIKPDRLIGHSVGEYVAATLAGVFTLEQATEIICTRGQLMQSMPEGSMLAVSLPADEAVAFCNDTIALAVVNSPAHSVLAGPTDAVTALNEELKARKIQTTILKTSHAFHSPMMGPAAETFVDRLGSMHFNKPSLPILSNVTGNYITDDDAVSAQYWGNHIRNTVQFSEGARKILQNKEQILIEVGPGNTLCSLVKMQDFDTNSVAVIPALPGIQQVATTYEHFLRAVGQVWMSGGTIDWDTIADVSQGRRVHLPTYSFEKVRHWIEPEKNNSEPDVKKRKRTKSKTDDNAKKNVQAIKEPENVTVAIIQMWKDLLGVDTVTVESNYFELGGTSLQALRLFEQVEKRFGVYLPVGTLINAPTVEQLVKIIEKKDDHAKNWSLVVPIRSTGHKKPLFLIHGGAGNVLLYRELAMCLPDDQPVYGIQAQGLNGKDAILTSIEEMAERYVKEIQLVDPEGPYYLGGYCLGGTIIYEMARHLTTAGKRVGLVAMFDTYREWFELTRAERFRYLFDNIGFHVKNIAQASPKGKVDFIKERGFEAVRRVKRKMAVMASQALHSAGIRKEPPLIIMETVNDAAAMNYVAKPYSGKITVFKPKSVSDIVDPYLGWKSVETGGVDLVNLSAYRNGILISPFVKEMAEELKKRLEQ